MSPKKHLPTLPAESPHTPEGGKADAGQSHDLNVSRRTFLGFTGATAALGMGGCLRRPVENILPFTEQAEYRVPGESIFYATVTERRGEALGLLVESHSGRPTKIEGNPVHPVTKGATDVFGQAEVLNLYDPDRSPAPARRKDGELVDSSWEAFLEDFEALVEKHEANEGEGLALLLEPTNSPSVRRMRDQVRKRFPKASVHAYSAISERNLRDGARLAFGAEHHTLYSLEQARVILSLDSDFLLTEPSAVRNARGFAERRRPSSPADEMSRLYVVEGTLSLTGASADHRLRLPSQDVEGYLQALAAELSASHGVDLGDLAGAVRDKRPEGVSREWIAEVAKDLAANRGRAPILVGSRQPARVHALAHALNLALGNVNTTVTYTAAEPSEAQDLDGLVESLKQGRVETLFILGGNPVYNAPADHGFADLLADDALTTIHLSMHRDETSMLSDWHLAASHELEAWGDQRAMDGTLSIQQPLVSPLYASRSELELLAMMAGERNWRGHHVVRATMRRLAPFTGMFESAWRQALHAGVVRGTEAEPVADVSVDGEAVAAALAEGRAPSPLGPKNLELVFAIDHAMFDGRFGNNPWMLELPHTITKLVWDNAALLSPSTASELGVETCDVVKISREGGKDIEIAAFVVPGHADWVVTLPMGWGRSAGRYGGGAGFDVLPIRTGDAFWFGAGARLENTGREHELVRSQEHDLMEGRPIALDATLHKVDTTDPRYEGTPAYEEQPQFAAYRSVDPTTTPLWEEVDYSENNKWGMTIDLGACTGCNACVIACQSENNIPTVGKVQAGLGRMMHWLRMDRYLVGHDTDDPMFQIQPMACQHCEEAPCENVCPVNATPHSPEGLNEMAYNRCVGTRYCMNNCPYKVRRFNYLNWQGYMDDPTANYGEQPETIKMQKNPNVSVRFRGVMEKCTYCVQRIQKHKIAARRENRNLRTDEFTSACAQACPSSAISFGNLNDPQAEVTRWAAVDRSYKVLAEVGTQPRTTYLGHIRNPNPAMLAGSTGTTEAT
ncbi:MAG: 4Fe-4S dicluster domain-containing protein [Myxococcota bacterium]